MMLGHGMVEVSPPDYSGTAFVSGFDDNIGIGTELSGGPCICRVQDWSG